MKPPWKWIAISLIIIFVIIISFSIYIIYTINIDTKLDLECHDICKKEDYIIDYNYNWKSGECSCVTWQGEYISQGFLREPMLVDKINIL